MTGCFEDAGTETQPGAAANATAPTEATAATAKRVIAERMCFLITITGTTTS